MPDPALRLRTAAVLLHQAAGHATPSAGAWPGGWGGFGGPNQSLLAGGPASAGHRMGTVVQVAAGCNGGCFPMSEADTAYIALTHPDVGVAVANLLDVALRTVAHLQPDAAGHWPPFTTAALAVADAVLVAREVQAATRPVEVA